MDLKGVSLNRIKNKTALHVTLSYQLFIHYYISHEPFGIEKETFLATA